MWKRCWDVIWLQELGRENTIKKRAETRPERLPERKEKVSTHQQQVSAFRTYKIYQNSFSEFSRNMVCLRTTNQQT